MRRPAEPPVFWPVSEASPDIEQLGPVGSGADGAGEARVPSWRLRAVIDKIQELLGLTERQIIHRYLADEVGISTRSVLRYDKGDVGSAPLVLVDAARSLMERVRLGRPVVFLRGRDLRPVVVRRQLIQLIDRVVGSGLFPGRFELFRQVEERLRLSCGRVARLYRSTDVQLIDRSVYDCIAMLASRSRYDPRVTYEVGDRIRHPVFGVGVVVSKVPREKIRVRFSDGNELTLRECLTEDPLRRRLHGQFDVPDAHVLSIGRH